jgi:DNA/RNA-binding domain of Phe-tRNA-synthetase-like protein
MVDLFQKLDARVFGTTFPQALAVIDSHHLLPLLAPNADVPFRVSAEIRVAVRDLLRQGGFKPSGRSKPASEYLVRAAGDGSLGPVNAAVDVCNVVSLHSGLPISVVDGHLAQPPFHIAVAPLKTEYVFNPSGQSIRLDGLMCLYDAGGPCGSPVKDSQRTKTHGGTTRTLTVIWGPADLSGHSTAVEAYYHQLLQSLGATIHPCGMAVDLSLNGGWLGP